MSNSRSVPVLRSVNGRTTSGMTSPAFCRTTQSPIRMSLRRTSSRLWRGAPATVAPEALCLAGSPDRRRIDDRTSFVRRRSGFGFLDELIGPGREQSAGGHFGVLLPKRAGAAVPGVRVERQVRRLPLRVDALEFLPWHEHLAANLEAGP